MNLYQIEINNRKTRLRTTYRIFVIYSRSCKCLRIIICVALFQLIPTIVSAQILRVFTDIDNVEFAFGPNFYSIQYTETATDKILAKPGLSASLDLLYLNENKVNITGRLFYEYKGYINKFTTNIYDPISQQINSGEIEGETFLNYCGVALLARHRFKNTGFFVESGLFTNYFLRGKLITKHSWDNVIYQDEIDEENNFSGGLVLSVGYSRRINKSLLFKVQAIENLGLFENVTYTFAIQTGFIITKQKK